MLIPTTDKQSERERTKSMCKDEDKKEQGVKYWRDPAHQSVFPLLGKRQHCL